VLAAISKNMQTIKLSSALTKSSNCQLGGCWLMMVTTTTWKWLLFCTCMSFGFSFHKLTMESV